VRRTKGTRARPMKACCMVSELLEETGIDRQQLRRVRRQVLEGIILLCQWQLQRMNRGPAPDETGSRTARRVEVE
jgi:hypothetical protein